MYVQGQERKKQGYSQYIFIHIYCQQSSRICQWKEIRLQMNNNKVRTQGLWNRISLIFVGSLKKSTKNKDEEKIHTRRNYWYFCNCLQKKKKQTIFFTFVFSIWVFFVQFRLFFIFFFEMFILWGKTNKRKMNQKRKTWMIRRWAKKIIRWEQEKI